MLRRLDARRVNREMLLASVGFCKQFHGSHREMLQKKHQAKSDQYSSWNKMPHEYRLADDCIGP